MSPKQVHRAEPLSLLEEVQRQLSHGIEDFRAYMATEEGRQLRKKIAQGLILTAPLLFRMRFFRATPVGRVLGIVGGTAAVVKIAEALRDWEPALDVDSSR